MRILIIGAGGVGTAAAQIIRRAGADAAWAELVVLADYNRARADVVADGLNNPDRFVAATVDASQPDQIAALITEYDIDFVMNAVEPLFNECIFDTCLDAGVHYLDCAMTLSKPHPTDPYTKTNVKLGDYQFARDADWQRAGKIAIVGSGVEPGMVDVFARYAADHLFDTVDQVNVRDGDNYTGGGDFGFSVWTTIEECLNPPIIWERERGWFTTERFSEPEIFDFPGGIGPVEVINVEHEEVLLVPRVIDCNRVTFKYGVPRAMRQMLLDLEAAGMTSADTTIKIGGSQISPRDFLVRTVPNPLDTAATMTGQGCAGVWVTGIKDGLQRSVYLYQIADNAECMEKYGVNSVVAQTAVAPVIMMELVATGAWMLPGVHGPESFDPLPFIARLATYEFPGGMREMDSEYACRLDRDRLLQRV
ncbi:MAG: saccharopine dehydrogenase NADP-binding domain-containing protein [Actinomycetes bacterium]|jgi:saccharopine dehydrogenase-like NADP-dependent oxidoreductase|nr:saccharopine dehydrogenase NADP-binding domain-containing protein [Actinomycetes bacterium]